MIVRCIENKGELLPQQVKDEYSFSDCEQLIIGKMYIVYALLQYRTHVELCIVEETVRSYPIWYPMNYFSISDNRLSRYWVFSMIRNHDKTEMPFLGFPEWASNDYFYYELFEGDEKQCNIFYRYKTLMDLEFPISSVTDHAAIVDEQWLMCPRCIDAWEYPDDKDAMVVCPMCQKMQHNPRYKNTMQPV